MLIAVALGALLAPLNSTMIAVAVPDIVDDFDTTVGTVGWLVTSYLLALAVVQPVAGKLGDRHGRRAFVLGGLAVFGVASLGAALAPSLAFLIVFRVLQAVSGAVVFPNGAGLIRELVPADRRGGAFGIVGGSIALAAGLGPLIGGVLVVAGGWRAIFFVNVPFVAAALAIAWRAVPRRPGVVAATAFDWLGAALLAAVLIGSALLVIEGGHAPVMLVPGNPAPARARGRVDQLGAAASRSRLPAALLRDPPVRRRERRHLLEQPCVLHRAACDPDPAHPPPRVVEPPGRPRACAAVGPDDRVLADRGRLADRYGRRLPSVAGCVVLTVGLLPPALAAGLSPYALLPCLALMGAGVGLSTAGLQTSAIEALDPSQAGVAAGLFSTSRYIGSFAGSIALARLLDHGHGLTRLPHRLPDRARGRDRLGAGDAGAARAGAVDRGRE